MSLALALTLWRNDVRNTVRDRTLAVLLPLPLLFAAALRFGLPVARARVPALDAHVPSIVAFFSVLVSMFPAFVLAFIMLDEKDEQIVVALRVVPVSPMQALLTRLALVTAASLLGSAVVIVGSGQLPVGPGTALLLSAAASGTTPIATLLVVTLGRNKIEGLAVLKGLFFVVILPLVAAVLALPGRQLLAVLPVTWTYAAFREGTPLRDALISMAMAALYVAIIARRSLSRLQP